MNGSPPPPDRAPRVQAAGEVGEGPGLLQLGARAPLATEAVPARQPGTMGRSSRAAREGQVWGWGPLCVNGPLSCLNEGS